MDDSTNVGGSDDAEPTTDRPHPTRLDRFLDWVLESRPTSSGLSLFEGAYQRAEVEIEGLREREGSKEWVSRADTYLRIANNHFSKREMEPAWSSLKAALREPINSYSPSELAIEAERVRSEAGTKLRSWRLATVNSLLRTESAETRDFSARVLRLELAVGATPQPQEKLENRLQKLGRFVGVDYLPDDHSLSLGRMESDAFPKLSDRVLVCRRILDDQTDNVYIKQGILGRTIRGASYFLTAILLALLGLVVWQDLAFKEGADGVLENSIKFLAVLVLGALGAVLSGATSAISTGGNSQIPDLRVRRILMQTRPLIGGASAVAVVVILQSGFTAVSLNNAGVFAVATVAGFSERLVSRTVETASRALDK